MTNKILVYLSIFHVYILKIFIYIIESFQYIQHSNIYNTIITPQVILKFLNPLDANIQMHH
jgi:hypothetical protein